MRIPSGEECGELGRKDLAALTFDELEAVAQKYERASNASAEIVKHTFTVLREKLEPQITLEEVGLIFIHSGLAAVSCSRWKKNLESSN